MTENHPPSPPSGQMSSKLKTMATQGLLGVVSLTAAAIIPILVQRFLGSPAPMTPASTVPGVAPTEIQSQTNSESQFNAQPEEGQRGRNRNKHNDDDDDEGDD